MSAVTFVIPAYNAASTLEAAVESIFSDNFTLGDAVIIVDDASTDSTGAVASKLEARHHPYIKVIRNEHNKGCPASRNVGIRLVETPLIMNLDADNILASGSVQKLVTTLEQEQADMAAFARYNYFTGNPRHITHYWRCRPGLFTLADLFAGHINPGPGGNFLYTKASWEKIGGYWEYGKGLHEAWGFTLKQLAAGARLTVVPGTHYFHRHGHASLFATESRNKEEEHALTKKMVRPYRDRFDAATWTYIETTPDWQARLEGHPLTLKGLPLGRNGTMRRTGYGIYRIAVDTLQSILDRLTHLISRR